LDFRRATLGELFGTAFVVGAAFHIALLLCGLLTAAIDPGFFHIGPRGMQVPAGSPGEAIGQLAGAAVAALLLNLLVSSGGAGLLVLARSIGLLASEQNAGTNQLGSGTVVGSPPKCGRPG
jgi:hypothetical protein